MNNNVMILIILAPAASVCHSNKTFFLYIFFSRFLRALLFTDFQGAQEADFDIQYSFNGIICLKQKRSKLAFPNCWRATVLIIITYITLQVMFWLVQQELFEIFETEEHLELALNESP